MVVLYSWPDEVGLQECDAWIEVRAVGAPVQTCQRRQALCQTQQLGGPLVNWTARETGTSSDDDDSGRLSSGLGSADI